MCRVLDQDIMNLTTSQMCFIELKTKPFECHSKELLNIGFETKFYDRSDGSSRTS